MPMPKPKSRPADKLGALQRAAAKLNRGPLWKGPEEDGITFSLLSRFLCCRERFRLMVVEGLKARDTFSAPLEFGNMWHACEEALASMSPEVKHVSMSGQGPVGEALAAYCGMLSNKYPLDRPKVDHWHQVTRVMFPRYVEHWREHPDMAQRRPLLQEQVFCVPYKLPSGRAVKLRGKWDSVDLVEKSGIWIQENKTKSEVNREKIERQLRFDLQTMMYVVALDRFDWTKQWDVLDSAKPVNVFKGLPPIKGVRYNVIKRPAHKIVDNLVKKLDEDKAEGRMGEWFGRWNVEVSAEDVARFRRECLDPILEMLCDWWDWIRVCEGNPWEPYEQGQYIHWRHPYGVYNVMDEGGFSDVDSYLETGSEVGLQRTDNLFPELT